MKPHFGISIIIGLGALSITINCVHGFVRRIAVEEKCAIVKKDCISSGNLFKRSIVCASNGKRFLNACSLQLRSCDLYMDSGEIITEERCLWIDQDEMEKIKDNGEEEEQGDEEEFEASGESDASEESEEGNNKFTPTAGFDATAQYVTTRTYTLPGGAVHSESTPESEDHFSASYFSESNGFFFQPAPEDIKEDEACNCRGDNSCPSCAPINLGGRVCGTDGTTYMTECALDTERCSKERFDLFVDHEGGCNSKEEHDGNDHVTSSSAARGPENPRGDLG